MVTQNRNLKIQLHAKGLSVTLSERASDMGEVKRGTFAKVRALYAKRKSSLRNKTSMNANIMTSIVITISGTHTRPQPEQQ